MKSSPGVASFFWGACLAAAFTAATATRYPCFTASPRAFLSLSKLDGPAPYIPLGSTVKRCQLPVLAASTAADGQLSQQASATSSRSRNGEGVLPSSPTSSRRQRRRVRRKTRLNSTKYRSISTTQLPDETSTIARDPEFPQLPTIGISPVTPQHGPFNDYDDYRVPDAGKISFPSDTVEVEDSERLIGARSEYSQLAVSVVAATGVVLRDEGPLSRERQQLMDMTRPPAELSKSTEARSFGHRHAANAAITVQEASSIGAESSSEGVGDIGIWASRGLLGSAAVIYGTNFGCVKMLEESLPMSLAAALRFSVSVGPFIPALLRINPAVLLAGAEIGVYNAMGYFAQSLALTTTTASKASFIGSLAVLVVPALDAMFGKKKHAGVEVARPVDRVGLDGVLSALNGPWFPAFLAAAGVACLELVGAEGDPPNVGDAWAFLQPICFASAFWRMERHCRAFAGHAWGLVGAQMLVLAVLSITWCTVAGEVPSSLDGVRDAVILESGSLAPLIAILWTGVVTTALSVYGETLAMQKVSAAESTVILSTVPIWGTLFAAVLLGESIGWNNALGAALIVSACSWKSVGPSLQRKLLSMIAATGAAAGSFNDAGSGVDVDELSETVGAVGTLVKDIVQDHM